MARSLWRKPTRLSSSSRLLLSGPGYAVLHDTAFTSFSFPVIQIYQVLLTKRRPQYALSYAARSELRLPASGAVQRSCLWSVFTIVKSQLSSCAISAGDFVGVERGAAFCGPSSSFYLVS